MKNIKIDDGIKSFTINGDPDKVISFDPTDINLGVRIMESLEVIEKLKNELPDEMEVQEGGETSKEAKKYIDEIKRIDGIIKEQIDYMLDAKVSSVVFGNTSTLAIKGGKLYIERFLDAVLPIIREAIESEGKASQKRIEKHTGKYKKNVQAAD